MSKDLFDRAIETGNNPDSWVKTAFNQILGSIYSCEIKEEELDKLIEEMAYYAMKKLDIKEENFNWQSIEEWQFKEQYNLAEYYLDFSEIKKIISKAKVSEEYDWEDIYSKDMPIEKINLKIVKDFKENFDDDICCYTKEEIIEKYNFIENKED